MCEWASSRCNYNFNVMTPHSPVCPSVRPCRAALLCYEDLGASSTAQARGLLAVISTVAASGVEGGGLEPDAYDALAARCAQLSARLLRRSHQVRLLAACSHLFWRQGGASGYKRPAEVLACLQRALRVADTISPPSPGLFVGLLEEYVFFLEAGVPTVSATTPRA